MKAKKEKLRPLKLRTKPGTYMVSPEVDLAIREIRRSGIITEADVQSVLSGYHKSKHRPPG